MFYGVHDRNYGKVFMDDLSSYKLYGIMLSEADRFITIYANADLFVGRL